MQGDHEPEEPDHEPEEPDHEPEEPDHEPEEPSASGPAFAFVMKCAMRGLRLRCPRCGEGRLFAGPIKMHESCSVCGNIHEFHPGNWSGAVMISQMLMGLVAVPVFILLSLLTPLDFTQSVFWTVVIVIALWLAFYRNIKGLWYGWLHANERADRPPAGGPAGGRV